LEAPDADAYDLPAHLAFNAPFFGRDERAEAFPQLQPGLPGPLQGQGQGNPRTVSGQVSRLGCEENAKPEIFRVRSLSSRGSCFKSFEETENNLEAEAAYVRLGSAQAMAGPKTASSLAITTGVSGLDRTGA